MASRAFLLAAMAGLAVSTNFDIPDEPAPRRRSGPLRGRRRDRPTIPEAELEAARALPKRERKRAMAALKAKYGRTLG